MWLATAGVVFGGLCAAQGIQGLIESRTQDSHLFSILWWLGPVLITCGTALMIAGLIVGVPILWRRR